MRMNDEYGLRIITETAARGAVYEGHGPQAVYDERSNPTFVAYRGVNADPFTTRYDHATETFDEPTVGESHPLGRQFVDNR